MRRVILSLIGVMLLAGCSQQPDTIWFTGRIDFPVKPHLGVREAMAAQLIPHPRQLEWQQLEMIAFIHFGINTFTGSEWGTGRESPQLFNPSSLDTDQWVRVLGEAGMKMVIITAKHHDGFCLWPTRTTTHSVASSPWKGGHGDLIGELKEACERHGMKLGVYLSPWDMNAPCYGDSPAYNRFFMEQLTELLTWYGPVDEVWLDGACGEGANGRRQEYDWQAYYDLIRELQPDAVTAIMGEDVRWVGTESGYGRETEWSATVLAPGGTAESRAINEALGVDAMSADLGSSSLLNRADHLFWYPAEVDVSIRPGWFWHADEDSLVKDVATLAEIYLSSVGRNAVLLLNVPPDDRGVITAHDIRSLDGFREWREKVFAISLLDGARPYGRGASSLIDDNNNTSWSPSHKRMTSLNPRHRRVASFVPAIAITCNIAMLQEDISQGQRVEKYIIEALTGSGWDTIASGTTIGYKRLIRFPEVRLDEVRLTIVSSRGTPHITSFALYHDQ